MKSTAVRSLCAGGIALAALAAGVAVAAPADAATTLPVSYDASGSTLVKKPNSTVQLGPSVLHTNLAADGSFTGSLALPPTTSEFKVIGLLPVKATVNFIPVGDVVGKLSTVGGKQRVAATAQYTIKLSNVTLAGLPAFVGNSCQTKAPVTIPIATPAGGSFNITTGGTVGGTYTIGQFGNCGLTTFLVNQLVPGPGNTLTFTLSNGRIGN